MQSRLIKIMASETRITLRYNGPSVDDGTLPLDDVVSALQGFAGAYTKVSNLRGESFQQELRVSAIKTGSFELVILAWLVLGQPPGPLGNLELAADATRWVLEKLFSIFEAKKHAKNKPYQISIRGDNNTVVMINAEGTDLAIPAEIVELLKTKTVDGDLNKIVSPLEPSKIESAEIVAESDNKEILAEKITNEEKKYFQPTETITIHETAIKGEFISLNKETKRGTFGLSEGKHVPYVYVGPNPDSFPIQFAHKGSVRVTGTITFDENLEPIQIAVKSVSHDQRELSLGDSTT